MNTIINQQVFKQFPVLESKRLIYRSFEKKDALDVLAIRSNEQAMKYMDAPLLENKKEALTFVEDAQVAFEEQKGINWAIVEKTSNQFIGYFGYWRLIPKHCRAEVGYALNPAYWGKGYMKETFRVLLDFAFGQLQVHSIEANVNPNNEASKQLLLKMGFRQEAYFRENYLYNGVFLDSVIYGLLEADFK